MENKFRFNFDAPVGYTGETKILSIDPFLEIRNGDMVSYRRSEYSVPHLKVRINQEEYFLAQVIDADILDDKSLLEDATKIRVFEDILFSGRQSRAEREGKKILFVESLIPNKDFYAYKWQSNQARPEYRIAWLGNKYNLVPSWASEGYECIMWKKMLAGYLLANCPIISETPLGNEEVLRREFADEDIWKRARLSTFAPL